MIGLDTIYYGTLTEENSADYYKIELSSSGCLHLNSTAQMEYVYDGKVKKPSIKVRDNDSKVMKSSTYTINIRYG